MLSIAVCVQAADLASSGGAFAAAVLGSAQLQRQSASLGSLASASASGTPRLAAMSTPSASLDKLQREDLLMHELDQARAQLHLLHEALLSLRMATFPCHSCSSRCHLRAAAGACCKASLPLFCGYSSKQSTEKRGGGMRACDGGLRTGAGGARRAGLAGGDCALPVGDRARGPVPRLLCGRPAAAAAIRQRAPIPARACAAALPGRALPGRLGLPPARRRQGSQERRHCCLSWQCSCWEMLRRAGTCAYLKTIT